jgi:ubiquinone/menaquinone biosynthesis C-methylase UbiE
MTQANDYDNWAAIRQKELKAGEKLPHRFVEKPAMKRLLPELKDKKVLLLGCGTGEESLLLAEHGAVDMVGVDLSKESIRLAQESYPKITFVVGDMHSLDFEDESFDFVYSSLTIHYSDQPENVYKELFRILKPEGVLQFSVGHPVRWASERIALEGVITKVLGYSENAEKPRLYGTYSTFKQYDETFPSGEVLRFWIAPPSTHFSLLRKAGFVVDQFVETRAIEECKAVDAYYYERNHEFPQFAVFVARKQL